MLGILSIPAQNCMQHVHRWGESKERVHSNEYFKIKASQKTSGMSLEFLMKLQLEMQIEFL